MVHNLYAMSCPSCLPGPGKPSPMMWELVPDQITEVLMRAGCRLLKHWTRRHHHSHVRFQYAPLVYKGDLFYLQRWAPVEWAVAPSQLIFHHEGWPCTEKTRTHGNFLSLMVRRAIAEQYPSPELSFSRAFNRVYGNSD
jgi:hypothetical protein